MKMHDYDDPTRIMSQMLILAEVLSLHPEISDQLSKISVENISRSSENTFFQEVRRLVKDAKTSDDLRAVASKMLTSQEEDMRTMGQKLKYSLDHPRKPRSSKCPTCGK